MHANHLTCDFCALQGLFEPTAAQEDAVNRAVLESIKIDDFDDYALKAFWRHRQAGHAPGLTHAQVTEILKAVCEMQKKYGITSK